MTTVDVEKLLVSGFSVINLAPLMRGDFYSRINHGYASRYVRPFFRSRFISFCSVVKRLTMRRDAGTTSSLLGTVDFLKDALWRDAMSDRGVERKHSSFSHSRRYPFFSSLIKKEHGRERKVCCLFIGGLRTRRNFSQSRCIERERFREVSPSRMKITDHGKLDFSLF